jgi:hypothetical protein
VGRRSSEARGFGASSFVLKERVQVRWNGCGNEPTFGFFLE